MTTKKGKTERSAGVVAFAFGVPSTLRSNCLIAEIAVAHAQRLGAPIYTQLDVSIDADDVKVIYAEEEPGNPPPTLRIAREVASWAQRMGFTDLLIAAAEPHVSRCERDIRYALKEIIYHTDIRICPEVHIYSNDDWFRPESKQKHTRSPEDWRLRELILMRLMPFWLYRRIAS